MDAFYVSVERRENPDLNGKPVIVGADPKSGTGRGVVMACSYEAREMGIRSGMPIGMAWRKVPTAVYLRPNYELYGAVSESVINVLRSYADILEHVSIDEAFLDVTSKVHGFDDASGYAARVKAAVREREGLACTIGVGPNKSISVERTFDRDVSEWTTVQETLRDVAHNVFLRARAQGATFRTIGIKIRFEGFQTHLRERTLGSHVLDEKVLTDVAQDLAKEFAGRKRRVRLLGVRVTHLERPKTKQQQLTAFE